MAAMRKGSRGARVVSALLLALSPGAVPILGSATSSTEFLKVSQPKEPWTTVRDLSWKAARGADGPTAGTMREPYNRIPQRVQDTLLSEKEQAPSPEEEEERSEEQAWEVVRGADKPKGGVKMETTNWVVVSGQSGVRPREKLVTEEEEAPPPAEEEGAEEEEEEEPLLWDARRRLRFPARWAGAEAILGSSYRDNFELPATGTTAAGTPWIYRELVDLPSGTNRTEAYYEELLPLALRRPRPTQPERRGVERELQMLGVAGFSITERAQGGWIKAAGMGFPVMRFTWTVSDRDGTLLLELSEQDMNLGKCDIHDVLVQKKQKPWGQSRTNTRNRSVRLAKGSLEAATHAFRRVAAKEQVLYDELLRALPVELPMEAAS